MIENLRYKTLFLIGIILTSFFIHKYAFINNKLTCNNYILNTYLYVILSVLLMVVFVSLMEEKMIQLVPLLNIRRIPFWLFLGLGIFVLISTMNTDPNNVLIKHLGWLGIVAFLSFAMLPVYLISKSTGIFYSTLFATFGMLSILTAIAFYNPNLISLSWGNGLLILLIAAILIRLGLIFLANPGSETNNYHMILSHAIVILFGFFILYDTKKLQINAKICKIPDYINESLGLFLDIINVFANLVRGRIRV